MGSFQDFLNSYRKNSFTPALDLDGYPIPGTSTGIPSLGGGLQQMPYGGGEPMLIQMPNTLQQTNPSSGFLFQRLIPRRN